MKDLEMMLESLIESCDKEETFMEAGFFAERKYRENIQPALYLNSVLNTYSIGVEKDGQIYDIERSKYSKFYHFLTDDDFLQLKGGLSFEYACFEDTYLKRFPYFRDSILVYAEIPGTNICHLFKLFRIKVGNEYRFLYPESAMKNLSGVYSHSDMGVFFKLVSRMLHLQDVNLPDKVDFYAVQKPREYGMSFDQLRKKLRSEGKLIASTNKAVNVKASTHGINGHALVKNINADLEVPVDYFRPQSNFNGELKI